MPKATTPTSQRQERRHNPLEADILATGPLKAKSSKKKAKEEKDETEHYVDATRSRNILRLGRELVEADEAERAGPAAKPTVDLFGIESRYGVEEAEAADQTFEEDEEAWGDEDDVVEEIEVSPEDLETYRKFMPENDEPSALLKQHGWDTTGAEDGEEEGESINLADLILSKIQRFEAAQAQGGNQALPEEDDELPPKVIDVYTKIGAILSRYKSGQLPKPLKILPTLPQWERIIEVTDPPKWTPNATYQVTRIFSSAKPIVCQRFMEIVVLDKVRENIYDEKKLNIHYFNALKKSLYRPRAFFLGFLFPLVASSPTIREAHIVSAVLSRVSVPVLHSAAALKGLCDIAASEGPEGNNVANIFIKTLLEKRYALPYQVIDSLVFHFLRFRSVDPASVKDEDAMRGVSGGTSKALPVVFHQGLLAFAARYKTDLSEDQREALLDLLLTHGHPEIAPEIRRELLAGRGHGVPIEQQSAAFDGDDTMLVDS